MNRRLLVFGLVAGALAGFSASGVPAQTGKITGIVTDATGGAPLAGVQIFLEGTGRGTLTQSNGRYFLINVPAGTYTVGAQLIGYAPARAQEVQIGIDATRTLDFKLSSQAVAVAAVVVTTERVPLVETRATGTGTALTAQEIETLPVTDLAGVLKLQNGFLPIPSDNTDILSYNDARRGISPIRIRGGRYGETLTMIDGLPINNVLFGGPAFDITTFAIEQLNLESGGFQAQYGNMLSGIINQATKEGSAELRGSLNYQTSGVAGALGSRRDDVRNYDQFEGFVAGPVPGTGSRLRYLLSARQLTTSDRVLEFDDLITTPTQRPIDELGRPTWHTDFLGGWQGVGFSSKRDLYGKLTYLVKPTAKLNLGGIYYEQQRKPYNRDFMYIDRDFLAICMNQFPGEEDYCRRLLLRQETSRMEDLYAGAPSFLQFATFSTYNSVARERNMLWAKWDHTVGKSAYTVSIGRLSQDRLSCNWLAGVCLGDNIRNYTTVGDGSIVPRNTRSAPLSPWVGPAAGTENFFGSDTMHTNVARADLQSQVNEHHLLKTGVFFQRHDFVLHEARNGGRPRDSNEIMRFEYRAEPWDIGFYLQDRIEYDFMTIDVGLRVDHFNVPGSFFNNPLDPTNGTTAFEVCEGMAPSLGATEKYRFDAGGGRVLEGISACSLALDANGQAFLMDSARVVAFQDDFGDVPGRTEISPRIGFSFPVTTNIRLFANYGRFTQNPLYNNLLQRTGIGRVAEKDTIVNMPIDVVRGGEAMQTNQIKRGDRVEGTPMGPDTRALCQAGSFCVGQLLPLMGNPRLRSERTSSYEIGLRADLWTDYGLSIVAYSKDQTGLTGARRGGVTREGVPINDVGETYGKASPGYYILVNTDYQTVRGFELQFRRRVKNYWGFDVNYAYQQAWTNAAPPDLEIQKIYEGDPPAFTEIRSEIDLPHVFSAILRFSAANETPDLPVGRALRNLTATVTGRLQSGFAYTPELTRRTGANAIGTGERADRNSGTSPAIYTIDLAAEKALRVANLRYTAFFRVNNLFDFQTCAQVFPSSGRCDVGSLSLERGTVSTFQNGSPGSTIAPSGSSAISTTFDRPDMISDRRSITAGLRVSF